MKREITMLEFVCDGCQSAFETIKAMYPRPPGWVEDEGRHYHDISCWFAAVTSRRVIVQGRGTLSFSEAAEDYLK